MKRLALALPLLLLIACGGSQSGGASEDIDPHRLYPLRSGNVWTYDVDTGVDLPVLGISRVVEVEGNRVSVTNNDSPPILYELRPEGIYRVTSDTWLLRRPIEVGATWASAGGREAKVTAVDEQVEVTAGTFEHCVRVEESDERQVTQTVYCPDVGPVVVDTQTGMELSGQTARVRGELRAYMLETESETTAE